MKKAAIRVKKLVFEKSKSAGPRNIYEAGCVFGFYMVKKGKYVELRNNDFIGSTEWMGDKADSIEHGIELCQAHYEQLVLSCLENDQ